MENKPSIAETLKKNLGNFLRRDEASTIIAPLTREGSTPLQDTKDQIETSRAAQEKSEENRK